MEELLFNYGVLGVWTVVNLLTIKFYREKEQKQEEKLIQVIDQNTRALTRVYEKMRC
jgi:hypothetical protein